MRVAEGGIFCGIMVMQTISYGPRHILKCDTRCKWHHKALVSYQGFGIWLIVCTPYGAILCTRFQKDGTVRG